MQLPIRTLSLVASLVGSRSVSAFCGTPLRRTCSISSSARRAMVMGVHITVPEEWTVQSTVGDGTAKRIGTHNGSFHCDEALACALLKLLPEWKDAVIVRTRDPAELDKCDIVVDVGGTYDAAKNRFDHHQKSFQDTLEAEGFRTRLSSAGLVYKHFGRDILHLLAGDKVPKDVIDNVLYGKVYKNFVEHVDGIDNGVEVAEGALNYQVSTGLSSRVKSLNPRWNEESSPDAANQRFKQAMSLTGGEMTAYIGGLVEGWWPARAIVEKALEKRMEVHPSGEVLLLETYCPWVSHLFDLEKEGGLTGTIKYTLYEDSNGSWRIQAVPEAEASFVSRLPLPEEWRGVRDEDLSKLTGIPGCIFAHATGFIGGNQSKEGVLEMASKSLAGDSLKRKEMEA